MPAPRPAVLGLMLVLLAGCACVQAQQVYRIVGPDGKVTFSDRPAVSTADRAPAASAAPVDARPNGPAVNIASLPYELRLVAQRYPVTLYTSDGCAPCGDARALLRGRGVPFLEKTVASVADGEALTRLSGGTSLPYATIGPQALQGFSSTEWAQYLDLAGYPKQSQLPASYQAPAASPLVAVASAPATAAGAARQGQRPAQAPAPASAAPRPNPAGIQF